MSENLEIICGVFIEATPETVFSFLTQQEKAAQWFGDIVDIEGKPDGQFYVSAESGAMYFAGKYTEIEPYEKIVFTWGGMFDLEDGQTTVEILLHEEKGGTRLSLRHYNIPTQEPADNFRNGWLEDAFPLLKLVSEGGVTDKRCCSDYNECCDSEQNKNECCDFEQNKEEACC